MFNVGTGEMLIILVVALLVLGPTRLPELARGIGKFVRQFRRQTEDVRSMVEREFYKMDDDIRQLDQPQDSAPVPASPSPGYPTSPELLASESSTETTDPGAPALEPSASEAPIHVHEALRLQTASPSETPGARDEAEVEGAEPTLVMNLPEPLPRERSKAAEPGASQSDHEDKLGRNR